MIEKVRAIFMLCLSQQKPSFVHPRVLKLQFAAARPGPHVMHVTVCPPQQVGQMIQSPAEEY